MRSIDNRLSKLEKTLDIKRSEPITIHRSFVNSDGSTCEPIYWEASHNKQTLHSDPGEELDGFQKRILDTMVIDPCCGIRILDKLAGG